MTTTDPQPRGGTPESPWQVREVSARIGDWLGRLGRVWIEGEVAQLTLRPGLSFLVLRDSSSEVSLQVVASRPVLEAAGALNMGPATGAASPLADGMRVVVHAAVEWWDRKGELRLRATEIRPAGVGELLAVIEARRRLLAAEGLFDDSRKRPLPFLPRRVGLVCGRGSAAMTDVVENARRRWPAVEFELREVPVQGPESARAVRAALIELDAEPEVDVIVITRGGGSFEDLLPFSDESLLRAVAAAVTPVVSAIGHEEDSPLLDLVADVRASTPTDAARRVVPDAREQRRLVRDTRDRIRARIVARISLEAREVAVLRARPALATPLALLADRVRGVELLRQQARSSVRVRLRHEAVATSGRRAELMALSPQGTLDRGFAVVRRLDRSGVITSSDQAREAEELDVRLARGSLVVTVTEVAADATPPGEEGST